MERRYKLMAHLGVRNLNGYNKKVADANSSGSPVKDPTWKINEAENIEKLGCPHCGKQDYVEYVRVDQREKYNKKWE